MNVHRKALAFAAVLAATVLTGGAAILGIAQRTTPATPAAAPAALFQHAPAAQSQEEAD